MILETVLILFTKKSMTGFSRCGMNVVGALSDVMLRCGRDRVSGKRGYVQKMLVIDIQ